jgi:hypothetical protein
MQVKPWRFRRIPIEVLLWPVTIHPLDSVHDRISKRQAISVSDNEFSYADDEELVNQFVNWTSDAVKEMREVTDALPERSDGKSEPAERLYDLAHNIKGMGASFDFLLLTEVGSSLCVYIKKLEGEMSRRVVDAHVRVFEVVLANKITGNGGETGQALTARLNAIIQEEK